MAKWIYDKGKVPLEYPTLGFTAKVGDILNADAAPDRRWSSADPDATETVFNLGEILGHLGDLDTSILEILAATVDAFEFDASVNKVYRQAAAPTDPDTDGRDLVENDRWFETDNTNRPYRWDGAAWVDSTTSWLITNPTTTFPNVVLSPAGLAAYNSGGTLVTSIDSSTGDFTTTGGLWVAGDISGATVTGGTVQTDAAANTGIKINSAGLAAYDAGGSPTLAIDAATGGIVMLGGVLSGGSFTASGGSVTAVLSGSASPGGSAALSFSGSGFSHSVYSNSGALTMYSNNELVVTAPSVGIYGTTVEISASMNFAGSVASTTAAPNLRVGAGGAIFEANTSLGPSDSGGSGFRLVRVPN